MTVSAFSFGNSLPVEPLVACLENSPRAREIANCAKHYARLLERPLVLFHALGRSGSSSCPPDPLELHLRRQQARHVFNRLCDELAEQALSVTLELWDGDWPDALTERFGNASETLFVIGSACGTGSSSSNGPIAHLMSNAMIGPILLVPPGYHTQSHGRPRIAVPVDGSNFSEVALAEASRIAHHFKAELLLIHVVPDGCLSNFGPPASADVELQVQVEQHNERIASEFLEQTSRRLNDQGINVRSICLKGDPRACLSRTIEDEQADLVIFSARGQGEKRCPDLPLGSTASYLIDHLNKPTLVLGSTSPARHGKNGLTARLGSRVPASYRAFTALNAA